MKLSLDNIVTDVRDVPNPWIFEHYLNLAEKLHGQSIKIHSVFRSERTPSMAVFYDNKHQQYRFKDFSSGEGGSAYDLVCKMFDLNFSQAIKKIVSDYTEVKLKGEDRIVEIVPENPFRVEAFEVRSWIQNDAIYWKQYGISRKQLEKYNVKPLKSYRMSNGKKTIDFEPKLLSYGYFSMDGTLYKIYSPKNPKRKFFKLADHVQGIEQLDYVADILVICSSLKDAMCLDAMGFKLEVIAPDSENTMIKPHYIDLLRRKYKKIITLFDNDEAGIKAIERYKETYGINGCFYPTAKDISDAVAAEGQEKVKDVMHRMLTGILSL